jgi:hypothetical protein
MFGFVLFGVSGRAARSAARSRAGPALTTARAAKRTMLKSTMLKRSARPRLGPMHHEVELRVREQLDVPGLLA